MRLSHIAVCSLSQPHVADIDVKEMTVAALNFETCLERGDTQHSFSSNLKWPAVNSSRVGVNKVRESLCKNLPKYGISTVLC